MTTGMPTPFRSTVTTRCGSRYALWYHQALGWWVRPRQVTSYYVQTPLADEWRQLAHRPEPLKYGRRLFLTFADDRSSFPRVSPGDSELTTAQLDMQDWSPRDAWPCDPPVAYLVSDEVRCRVLVRLAAEGVCAFSWEPDFGLWVRQRGPIDKELSQGEDMWLPASYPTPWPPTVGSVMVFHVDTLAPSPKRRRSKIERQNHWWTTSSVVAVDLWSTTAVWPGSPEPSVLRFFKDRTLSW